MADVVVFGYLFTFLLINVQCAGLPGLDSLSKDGWSSSSPGPPEQLLDSGSLDNMMVHTPRYNCHYCEDDCLEAPPTVCSNALYCFKSSVLSDGQLRHTRGCTNHPDQYQLTCWTRQHLGKRDAGVHNVSCCRGELCNGGAFPALGAGAGAGARPPAAPLWAGAVLAALAAAAALPAALYILRRTHRMRVARAGLHKLGADTTYLSANMYTPHLTSAYYEGVETSATQPTVQATVQATAAGDSTLRQYLETSVTSGSGSGLPLMVQRTLAKQVDLIECVGKGRYGEVWRGSWCAESVAVKIFFSRDEASWRRETEIYSTVMLRHDNILAYVASDMTSRAGCTQLWLITQFHPLGSLYEHLARCTLTRQQMMAICLSTVNGILHLHTEIHGTQGKPAIAHRDIKSKNILVKADGSCCVGDLGLAVTRAHLPPAPPRQGTRRYMAPELLDLSMRQECLEAHQLCDIYALGLVLWEACRRVKPRAAEPRPPYHELAPADPSFDDMRKIVCVDCFRPEPPDDPHPTMVGMAQLMRECWHGTAAARLPALRVKKTLLKLAAADGAIRLNDDNEVAV